MTEQTVAIHLADELADAVGRVASSLFLTSGHGHRAASATALDPHHLVASDHLLPQSEAVTLTSADGVEIEATIVGRDRLTDLVLLRSDAALTPLPHAEGAARPGQLVVSVGLSWTGLVAHPGFVTSVSGPHETRSGLRLERLIDTSLSPFSGFSGGPLVDGRGALVGISSSAIVKGSARAVPTADVLRVAELLRTGGRRRRGYLGVSTVAVSLPVAQRQSGHAQGLLVVSLADEGPAAQAGVLVGDVLVTAAGTALTRTRDLLAVVRDADIGQHVAIELMRGTQATSASLQVGERPARAE